MGVAFSMCLIVVACQIDAKSTAYSSTIKDLASTDCARANNAKKHFLSGGTDVFPILLKHLDDRTILPCSRSLTVFARVELTSDGRHLTPATLNLGTLVFDIIRIKIEGYLPKTMDGFETLTPGNVKKWLSDKKSESMLDLQITAAREIIENLESYKLKHKTDTEIGYDIDYMKNRLKKLILERENTKRHGSPAPR